MSNQPSSSVATLTAASEERESPESLAQRREHREDGGRHGRNLSREGRARFVDGQTDVRYTGDDEEEREEVALGKEWVREEEEGLVG